MPVRLTAGGAAATPAALAADPAFHSKFLARLNAAAYGAVGDGTTADGAALATAYGAAETAKNGMWLPPGVYPIASALTLTTDDNDNDTDGFVGIFGPGAYRAKIRQDTANTKGVSVGGRGQKFNGFSIIAASTAAPADSSSIGLSVDTEGILAEYADLVIDGFNIGARVNSGVLEFNSIWRNIRVAHWYRAAFVFGQGSGSLHENLYASAIGVGSVLNMVETTDLSGEFIRLNLERSTVRNQAIRGTACHNVSFYGLHMEELSFIGSGFSALRSETFEPAFYRTTGRGVQTIRNWTIDSCHVGGYIVDSLTRSGSTATATLNMMGFQQKVATGHGIEVGDSITVAGANESEYNGTFTATAVTTTTVSYTVSGTPTTPATVLAGSDCIVLGLGQSLATNVPLVKFESAGEIVIDGLYIRDTRVVAHTAALRRALFRLAHFVQPGRLTIKNVGFGNQSGSASHWRAPNPLAGYSRTSNVTTLWFTRPHRLRTDAVLTVKGATDSSFNATSSGTLTIINEFAVSFSQTGSDKALTRDTGATAYLQTAAITTGSRTSDICLVTTSAAHGLGVGAQVAIAASDTAYDTDNALVLSVPSTTTFTIRVAGADKASAAVTGTVQHIEAGIPGVNSFGFASGTGEFVDLDVLTRYCSIFAPGAITAGSTGAQSNNIQSAATTRSRVLNVGILDPHASLIYSPYVSGTNAYSVRAMNPTAGSITPNATAVFVTVTP